MTPKLLKSFLKLAEMGNLSRSAAQLHLTQPALSRQMQLLEEEVGTRLFERHGRGVVLTDAGRLLRKRAEKLLRDIDEIRHEITASASEPEGEVALGLPTPLNAMLAARVVDRLWETAPKLRLRIFEGAPHQIRDQINLGQLDLGVLSADEYGAGLIRLPFVTERLFVAGAPRFELENQGRFAVEKLLGIPLVQASPQNGVTMILTRHFSKAQRALDLRIEASSTLLMIAIAATGRCFTVLPYSALAEDIKRGTISAAPMTRLTMHWAMARRADHRSTAAMKAVVQILHDTARARIDAGEWPTARYVAKSADL
jgi:DNA-binding transcriptional LysR family regulator